MFLRSIFILPQQVNDVLCGNNFLPHLSLEGSGNGKPSTQDFQMRNVQLTYELDILIGIAANALFCVPILCAPIKVFSKICLASHCQ